MLIMAKKTTVDWINSRIFEAMEGAGSDATSGTGTKPSNPVVCCGFLCSIYIKLLWQKKLKITSQ